MQVYYSNTDTNEHIDSYQPVEINYNALHLVFLRLSGSGSFLGVVLSEQLILQFLIEDGAYWTELLNPKTLIAEGCYLSKPLAESVLKSAMNGEGAAEMKAAEMKAAASLASPDYPYEWIKRKVP